MNQLAPRLVSMILSQNRSRQRRPRRGFALVITMALMVLLMVLAVGLLGLSSIELRSSGATSAAMQARANARLALQIAIGELQLQAGPDQRITASGGQKVQGKSGRKNWVGVYDSWSDKQITRPDPSFRRWLISGSEQLTSSEAAAKNESPLADATVALAKETEESDAVDAGLVDVKDGAYAWWISDNNMKAKIGNTVETPKDYKEVMAQMQAAPWASLEPFFDGQIAKTDIRLNNLFTVGTAGLMGQTTQPLFHDATTIAEGLVTNVRSGGFRKDLSFFLEKPYDVTLSRNKLYSVGAGTGTPGINFGELWAAQNIWGEVISSPTGETLIAPLDVKSRMEDPFRSYNQLTRIQHTIVYSLVSRAVTPTTYEVYLVVDPIITLWNPFNITVTVPKSDMAYTGFQNWSAPYVLDLEIVRPPKPTIHWKSTLSQITPGGNFNTALAGKTQDVVLRPGEVQILSQSYQNGVVNKNDLEAKPGLGFGSGFQFKLGAATAPPNPFPEAAVIVPPATVATPVFLGPTARLSYKLTPSPESEANALSLIMARQYIGNEDTNGYGEDMTGIGNMSVDFTTKNVHAGDRDGGVIRASQKEEFFRRIEYAGTPKTVSSMVVTTGADASTRKWPLFIFNMGIRAEEDQYGMDMASLKPTEKPPIRYTSRSLMSFNPKMLTYDLGDLSQQATNESPLQIGVRGNITSFSNLIQTAGNQGFFGGSFTAGASYVATHAVPRQPIYSLGALQHSMANGLLPYQDGLTQTYQIIQYLRPALPHAVSNSFAPSMMGSNQTESSQGTGKYAHPLADHSYLANRALWDDYFYSSISPQTTTAHKNSSSAYSEQKQRLTSFFGAKDTKFVPLPNSRMRPWGDSEKVVAEVFPGAKPSEEAYQRIGGHLMIDGAFNVNSTSERAWESMLMALKGSSVPVSGPGSVSKEPSLISSSKTPVAGMTIAAGGEISDGDMSSSLDTQQWTGFRSLTDDQIKNLASAIVKQVRLRGPFISLSDFINRRPGNDKDLALSGALQSALDDSNVSINRAFRSGNRAGSISDANAKKFPFPEAEAIAKSAGAPGYVKQGDLLTTLGPLLAVRGDTFTIRTCGEARDQQGRVLARAYCEAVVQRVPDYVDPTDANYTVIPKATANTQFGRKFQIISFRNLAAEEL